MSDPTGIDDPAFVADCMALTKRPAAPLFPGANVMHETARGEAGSRAARSDPEHTMRAAATRPSPADHTELQGTVRRLRTHIEELREALTESQAQNEASSATERENEVLRQALIQAREQRASNVSAIEDLVRQVAAAQSELETMGQTLSTTTAERGVEMADLREARRREAEVRDQLATAMTAISGHDAEVERLRQVIANRDLEIGELRQRLLQAEEARAADAAAFLDSLNQRTT